MATELYKLHLRVERIAHALRERRQKGWIPLKKHVDSLYEISIRLKCLDKNPKRRFDDFK
jgi:hypothetical protein